MQQTLTKCGPNCASHQRSLSRSGLRPNVAQIVPLVGGLSHPADFDQMWSKMCPSSEDFVSLRTLTKCGPNICPSSEDFDTHRTSAKCGPNMCPFDGGLRFATEFDYVWINNALIIKKGPYQKMDFNRRSTWNWNCRLRLRCHVINTLRGIRTNKPRQRHDGSRIHHATNNKWRRSHTTITDTSL